MLVRVALAPTVLGSTEAFFFLTADLSFFWAHPGSRSFATTSSLNDRLKLMRKAAFPDYQLAPQVLLNCALGAFPVDERAA